MVKALVLYHSQEFGNTAAMAEAVAEGIQLGLRNIRCYPNGWDYTGSERS